MQALAPVRGAGVDPEVFVRWLDGHDELPLEGLTEDDVQKGGDAAVGIAHADGDVVGIREGGAGLIDAKMDELENVIGCPAHKESQANGHRHAGYFFGAQP